MAEKILFEIEYSTGEAVKRLADVSREQRKLKEENKELAKSFDENAEQIKQNDLMYRSLSREAQELTKQVEQNTIRTTANTGSLKAQRAELSILNKRYSELSKEERENTAAGAELQKRIKSLSEELGKNEKALGNNSRNVGNYKEDIKSAFSELNVFGVKVGDVGQKLETFAEKPGIAAKGVGFLNGAFKVLLGNPIVLFIALLVAGFVKLASASDAFKDTFGQLTASLSAGFGFLVNGVQAFVSSGDGIKSVGNSFKAFFDFVTVPFKTLIFLLEGFAKGIKAIATGDFKALGQIGADAIGKITKDFTKSRDTLREVAEGAKQFGRDLANAATTAASLTKRLQELEDLENDLNVVQAKANQLSEVATIKAKDRTKTDAERIALLTEANVAQEKAAVQELAFLNERLAIAQKQRALAAKGGSEQDAQREAENAARIAVINAESSFQNLRERNQNRINAISEQAEADRKKAADEAIAREEANSRNRIALLEDEGAKKLALLKLEQEKEFRAAVVQRLNLDLLRQRQAQDTIALNKQIADERVKAEQDAAKELERLRNAQGEFEKQEEAKRFAASQALLSEFNSEARLNLADQFAGQQIDQQTFNAASLELTETELESELRLRESYGQSTVAAEQALADFRIAQNQRENDAKVRSDADAAAKREAIARAYLSAVSSVQEGITAIAELANADQETLIGIQKGFALLQIAIDTAKAISALTAGAATVSATIAAASGPAGLVTGPAAYIAYYATNIASILAGIAQAKQLLNFEQGGEVPTKGDGVNGIRIGGKRHSQGGTDFVGSDGTRFKAEQNERVFILKRHDSKRIAQLSRENQRRGGVGFYALGGEVSTRQVTRSLSQGVDTNRTLLAAFAALPAPIVTVSAIDKVRDGQRNIRVKSTIK